MLLVALCGAMATKRKGDEWPTLLGDGDLWVQNFHRLVEELLKINFLKDPKMPTKNYIESPEVVTLKFNFIAFNLKHVEAEEAKDVCFSWKQCLVQAAGVAVLKVVADCYRMQVDWLKKRVDFCRDQLSPEMLKAYGDAAWFEKKVEVMEQVEKLIMQTECFSYCGGCGCVTWRGQNQGEVRQVKGLFAGIQYQRGLQLWGEARDKMIAYKWELKVWSTFVLLPDSAKPAVDAQELEAIVCLKGKWSISGASDSFDPE